MENKKAIAILKDELKHCKIHLEDKNKAPEYYQEMNELCEAYEMAIKALESSSWISIKTRDLTDEEIEELVKQHENMFSPDEIEHWCFDCRLPEDNQEVIVSTQWGVRVVTFYNDYDYGCYFEEYEDRGDVLAWMPLPEPYTKEDSENDKS